MNVKAKVLQRLYAAGRVTKDGLRQSVTDGVITATEYEIITGETYA